MAVRALSKPARLSQALVRSPVEHKRAFSVTLRLHMQRNRIYDAVRSTDELDSLRVLRSPFITLWTASWCGTCKTVRPLIRDVMEQWGVEQTDATGVGFAEVELDAPSIGEAAMRYQLTSVPTLLSFRKGEPNYGTKVTDVTELADKDFLQQWLEEEARRGDDMGNQGKSLFGGVFAS